MIMLCFLTLVGFGYLTLGSGDSGVANSTTAPLPMRQMMERGCQHVYTCVCGGVDEEGNGISAAELAAAVAVGEMK